LETLALGGGSVAAAAADRVILNLPPSVRLLVATEQLDGRRSFDALSALVEHHLERDPLSGHLSCLLNRRRDEVKAAMRFVAHGDALGRTAFFLGPQSAESCWYFSPVAFALKTPAATLALLARISHQPTAADICRFPRGNRQRGRLSQ
jgi:hypothetical protein